MHGKNWPWQRPLPFMTIDSKCFKDCVEALRGQGNGKKNVCNSSLKNNEGDVDVPSDQASINIQERETNRKYIFLHERTKRNLLRVQEPNFTLPHWASGTEDVADLVSRMTFNFSLLMQRFTTAGSRERYNPPLRMLWGQKALQHARCMAFSRSGI